MFGNSSVEFIGSYKEKMVKKCQKVSITPLALINDMFMTNLLEKADLCSDFLRK